MTCNCDATQDSAAAGSGANCHIPALWQALTVTEAAALFGYDKSTIRYHLTEGHLTFRELSAGIFLIELDSLIRLFGTPARPNWVNFLHHAVTFEPVF